MQYNACEMLETAYFFKLTPVLGFFHACFACFLPSFEYHFNSLLLTLLLKSVLRFPALLSRVLWKPVISILSKFNWLVVTWCGIWVWGISEQVTNSFISFLFFFCLLVLYFCIAPSQLFFEYVSCKLFRWNLLILIGLLTCI